MKHSIILDLCGGTGSWSKPYVEAGYDVRLVTLPNDDVRTWREYMELQVHGVLAAPPCTYFCNMRNCRGKPTRLQLQEGLSTVDACLRIIHTVNPKWWALENPEGSLKNWLGTAKWKFQPCDYGDPWTKKTYLWGMFNPPVFAIGVEPKHAWISSGSKLEAGPKRTAEKRATTPPGFARAFFEANP